MGKGIGFGKNLSFQGGNRMDLKDFCSGVENAMTAGKAKRHAVRRKIDNAG